MKKDQHLPAFDLFLAGYDYDQLASIFEVDKRTIYQWAEDNNWRERKNKRTQSLNNIQNDILEMIEYETQVVKLFIKTQTSEATFERLPTNQIDGLNKLLASFKATIIKESKQNYYNIFTAFANYLENQNIDNRQEIVRLADAFLKEKIREFSK